MFSYDDTSQSVLSLRKVTSIYVLFLLRLRIIPFDPYEPRFLV